ncbi:diguanylate cyclase [Anaerobacillus sp. HL2]|nr:diguanylate cyclase [Anaerobacillus sp. HL2]
MKTLSKYIKRSMVSIARYGGEEFIVILPDTPYEGAQTLGEQL